MKKEKDFLYGLSSVKTSSEIPGLISLEKENILQNQLKLMKFVDENSPKKIEFNFSYLEKQNINTFEELKKAENLLKYGD